MTRVVMGEVGSGLITRQFYFYLEISGHCHAKKLPGQIDPLSASIRVYTDQVLGGEQPHGLLFAPPFTSILVARPRLVWSEALPTNNFSLPHIRCHQPMSERLLGRSQGLYTGNDW